MVIRQYMGTLVFLKFFISLYLFARQEIPDYFFGSSLFEKFSKSMRCVPSGDEIIDEENFFASERLSQLSTQRIFLSNSTPLFSCSARLVAGKELFLKRANYFDASWSEIINKEFRMIWTSKYPVSETNGWIDNDIRGIGKFLFHTSKKLSKVDTVDMIVDKLESMNPFLHIVIIIGTYDYFFEGKSRNEPFIMFGF